MKNKLNNLLRKFTIGLLIFAIILIAGLGMLGKKTKEVATDTTPKTETVKEVKTWQPKEVAEFNMAYISKSDKNQDGANAVINISKVELRDNDIVLTSGAPGYSDLKYAVDKYLAIKLRDEKGSDISSKLNNILVNQINSDVSEIVITGADLNAVKWIEILPYKTKNNNNITFKVGE